MLLMFCKIPNAEQSLQELSKVYLVKSAELLNYLHVFLPRGVVPSSLHVTLTFDGRLQRRSLKRGLADHVRTLVQCNQKG